jgi:hypothetical protein
MHVQRYFSANYSASKPKKLNQWKRINSKAIYWMITRLERSNSHCTRTPFVMGRRSSIGTNRRLRAITARTAQRNITT